MYGQDVLNYISKIPFEISNKTRKKLVFWTNEVSWDLRLKQVSDGYPLILKASEYDKTYS